jgi:hypothetical protein
MAEKDSVLIKKKLSEELPQYKYSVTRNDFAGGHSVNVKVLSGDIEVFAKENDRDRENGYIEIWRDRYKDDERINEAIKPDIDKMYKIIYGIGNFPSGYHGGPYLHWQFGSYSKPYEVSNPKKSTPIPKPSMEKPSGETNADSELLMSFPPGWSLFKTTIKKKDYDGVPITLVVYNLNKTKELKNIPYDKFLEFKGEMLTNLGMKWGKFQKFEKWTHSVDKDILKVIIEKYYGVGEDKKEQEFKVGDKILVVENGKMFTIKSIGAGGTTNVVYQDGTPASFFPRQITNGLENGSYKFVIEKEKEEQEFKVGDVYYSKLFEQKLTINKVQYDTIFVDYEDDSSERYTPQYFRLMVQRKDLIKVIDEEKQEDKEIEIKVGDVYFQKNMGQNIEIIKIDGDKIYFQTSDGKYFNNTSIYMAEIAIKAGTWVKITNQEKKENLSTEEEIKKEIAALEILAEDGDEDAMKIIEALKILLN